tara:strand:+ start:111 stop:737 length:627 start_codon:yes stop_codon:yes gene_type:complete
MSENEKRPQSLSADWDWNVFFDNVNDPEIRTTLRIALEYLGEGKNRQAIDLGCGHGNDTVHILAAGFKVLAVDKSADGLQRLVSRETLINRWNLKILESGFDILDMPEAAFINASYALPFLDEDFFLSAWNKMIKSLASGGVFSGHLFGVKDSWNGRVADMNFHSKEAIETLIKPYEVLHFDELEYDGKDAAGRPKHWHVFEIVIKVD